MAVSCAKENVASSQSFIKDEVVQTRTHDCECKIAISDIQNAEEDVAWTLGSGSNNFAFFQGEGDLVKGKFGNQLPPSDYIDFTTGSQSFILTYEGEDVPADFTVSVSIRCVTTNDNGVQSVSYSSYDFVWSAGMETSYNSDTGISTTTFNLGVYCDEITLPL